MKNRFILIIIAIIIFPSTICLGGNDRTKYVFLFIGDGMGISQVALTETYLASKKGIIDLNHLSFQNSIIWVLLNTFCKLSYYMFSSSRNSSFYWKENEELYVRC
jgi:hypothetical protein